MEFCGIVAKLCCVLPLHYQHGLALKSKDHNKFYCTRMWRCEILGLSRENKW